MVLVDRLDGLPVVFRDISDSGLGLDTGRTSSLYGHYLSD